MDRPAQIDNQEIYDANWGLWLDMKVHGPASRWLRHLVVEQIRKLRVADPAIESVLDVGCGEGTLTWTLATEMPTAIVDGIDLSSTGIEFARSRYGSQNLRFAEADLETAQVHDLVTAFEVLEHIERWEPFLQSLAERARRFLLLSFPTGRMRRFEVNMGHYRNFQVGEVERKLSQLGFEAVQLFYAGFPFYSPIYREVCNWANLGGDSLGRGTYRRGMRVLARLIYATFRFASTKHRFGDQFCGLFRRIES